MKKGMRVIAFLLAVLLLTLTGCGQNGGAENVGGRGRGLASSKGQIASSSPEEAPEKVQELVYPFESEEPVTLTYWMPANAVILKYVRSMNENKALIEAQKRTGISIQFTHPAAGQEKEQFNVMVASGEYPDIIAGPGNGTFYYPGGLFKAVDDGVMLDLTDQLPTWAPDYWKVLQEYELLRREISDKNGRIAGFYKVKPEMDPPHRRIQIRVDTLEKCGIQNVPEYLEDYDQLFAKILEQGITPWSPDKSGLEPMFMGMYGLGMYDVNESFMKDENGKVSYMFTRPEYRDYLEKMAEWYEKGFISKDFVSQNDQDRKSLFDSQKLGIVLASSDDTLTRANLQGFEVTNFPYPRLSEGEMNHAAQADTMIQSKNEVGISAKCSNPEAAMAFLNYFYTEEGAMLANWGVEGESYTIVDGKPQYIDGVYNNPDMDASAASNLFRLHGFPKLSERDIDCYPPIVSSAKGLEARTRWADDPNVDYLYTMPVLQLEPDELEERTNIMKDIDTYTAEMRLKFITGVEPLDNFDAYVKTVEGMNIEKAVEITQGAYDRFIEKQV